MTVRELQELIYRGAVRLRSDKLAQGSWRQRSVGLMEADRNDYCPMLVACAGADVDPATLFDELPASHVQFFGSVLAITTVDYSVLRRRVAEVLGVTVEWVMHYTAHWDATNGATTPTDAAAMVAVVDAVMPLQPVTDREPTADPIAQALASVCDPEPEPELVPA